MGSSQASGEFITTERWVRQLRKTLGLSEKQPIPYFEVLAPHPSGHQCGTEFRNPCPPNVKP